MSTTAILEATVIPTTRPMSELVDEMTRWRRLTDYLAHDNGLASNAQCEALSRLEAEYRATHPGPALGRHWLTAQLETGKITGKWTSPDDTIDLWVLSTGYWWRTGFQWIALDDTYEISKSPLIYTRNGRAIDWGAALPLVDHPRDLLPDGIEVPLW